jgi:hypothetical protein
MTASSRWQAMRSHTGVLSQRTVIVRVLLVSPSTVRVGRAMIVPTRRGRPLA